jgi:hypothetical protein
MHRFAATRHQESSKNQSSALTDGSHRRPHKAPANARGGDQMAYEMLFGENEIAYETVCFRADGYSE